MNLRDLREQFVNLSGRADLVDDLGNDAGADFFIRAGQQLLDRWGDFGTGNSGVLTLSVGAQSVPLLNCWKVQSVAVQLDCGKLELLQELTSAKAISLSSPCDDGIKGYYLERIFDMPRFGAKSKASTYSKQRAIDFALRAGEQSFSALRLRLVPKPSEPKTLRIQGLFAEPPLKDDLDENMWSVQHPMLLLKAALYQLEVCYRNTEGANDWMNAIVLERKEIEDQQLFGSLSPSAEMGEEL